MLVRKLDNNLSIGHQIAGGLTVSSGHYERKETVNPGGGVLISLIRASVGGMENEDNIAVSFKWWTRAKLLGRSFLRSEYDPARIFSSDFGCIGGRAGECTGGLSLLEGRKAVEDAAVDNKELIGGSSEEAEESEGGGASIPAAEAGATGAIPKLIGLVRSMAPLVVPASQERNDIIPCKRDDED